MTDETEEAVDTTNTVPSYEELLEKYCASLNDLRTSEGKLSEAYKQVETLTEKLKLKRGKVRTNDAIVSRVGGTPVDEVKKMSVAELCRSVKSRGGAFNFAEIDIMTKGGRAGLRMKLEVYKRDRTTGSPVKSGRASFSSSIGRVPGSVVGVPSEIVRAKVDIPDPIYDVKVTQGKAKRKRANDYDEDMDESSEDEEVGEEVKLAEKPEAEVLEDYDESELA